MQENLQAFQFWFALSIGSWKALGFDKQRRRFDESSTSTQRLLSHGKRRLLAWLSSRGILLPLFDASKDLSKYHPSWAIRKLVLVLWYQDQLSANLIVRQHGLHQRKEHWVFHYNLQFNPKRPLSYIYLESRPWCLLHISLSFTCSIFHNYFLHLSSFLAFVSMGCIFKRPFGKDSSYKHKTVLWCRVILWWVFLQYQPQH